MRRYFTLLPIMAMMIALALSLTVPGLHGAAHEVDGAHVHHAPAQSAPPDMPHDGGDIACKALCTGTVLTAPSAVAHAPAPRAAEPQPDAPRLWADWAHPLSPPPKHPA